MEFTEPFDTVKTSDRPLLFISKFHQMKKNLLLALFALLSIAPAAAASKNNFKEYQFSGLGAHVMVGGDLYVGLQAQYNLDDPIRLEGRVSVMPSYLPDNVNLALNGHYLFPVNQFVTFYPLVGVEVAINSHPTVGASFGGGAQFELADRINLTTELTGFFSKYSVARLSVGVNYRF